MRQVSVFDAKTHFSALINEVLKHGHTIEITRHGHPVAKLSASEKTEKPDIKATIQAMRKLKKEIGKKGTTIKELIEWKNEGKR